LRPKQVNQIDPWRADCISAVALGDSDAARLKGDDVPELSDSSSIFRSGGGWLFCG
jgi:hypothetical protein